MIKSNTITRIKTSFVLLSLIFLMIMYDIFSVYMLIIFGVVSILEFLKISEKISKKKIINYLLNFIFISYIFFFSYFYFYILQFFQLKILLFIILFGCVASDIGGFIFGRIFKGPKLTKISPKKTFSGSFGSIIFSCITISFAIFILTNNFSFAIMSVGFFTSLGCQIGDLIFSYLKRKAKLKDTGKILPGHGGVLDRIDGILLGVPVGIISLIIIS